MDPISCCLCPFSADSETILDMHIKEEHKNIFSNPIFSLNPAPGVSKRSKNKGDKSLRYSSYRGVHGTPKIVIVSSDVEEDRNSSLEHQSTPLTNDNDRKLSRCSTTSSNSDNGSGGSILDSTNSFHSNKSYSCNGCAFIGSSLYTLRKHRIESHTNEADVKEILSCKSCDFISPSLHLIKQHRKKVHPVKRGRPSKVFVEVLTAPEEDSTEAKKPKMEPAQRAKRKSVKVDKKETSEKRNNDEVSTTAEENIVSAEEKTILDVPDVKESTEYIPSYLGLVRSPPAVSKEGSLAILVKLHEQMNGAKTNSKFIEAVSDLLNTLNSILMKEDSAKSLQEDESEAELEKIKKENESLKKELQSMAFTHSETEMDLKKRISDLEAVLAEKSTTISVLEVELAKVKKEEQGLIDSAKHFLSCIQNLEQKN